MLAQQQQLSTGISCSLYKTCNICGEMKWYKSFATKGKSKKRSGCCNSCRDKKRRQNQAEDLHDIQSKVILDKSLKGIHYQQSGIFARNSYLQVQLAERLVQEGRAIIRRPDTIVDSFKNDYDFIRFIFDRDQYTCQFCGDLGVVVVQILPLNLNGIASPANCVCCCLNCRYDRNRKLRTIRKGYFIYNETPNRLLRFVCGLPASALNDIHATNTLMFYCDSSLKKTHSQNDYGITAVRVGLGDMKIIRKKLSKDFGISLFGELHGIFHSLKEVETILSTRPQSVRRIYIYSDLQTIHPILNGEIEFKNAELSCLVDTINEHLEQIKNIYKFNNVKVKYLNGDQSNNLFYKLAHDEARNEIGLTRGLTDKFSYYL